MKLKIKILDKEYDLTTTSDSSDGFIEVNHETGIWPRSYFESLINRNYGVYGKLITMENLTNLDLVVILNKLDMLVDYEPKIKSSSYEAYKERREIL